MSQGRCVGLLFGGRSAEHEVSILSARNVARALAEAGHRVLPLGVARDGTWRLCAGEDGTVPAEVPTTGPRVTLRPGGGGDLLAWHEDGRVASSPTVDVLFPVLHGPFGEDGTVQGLAELAGLPYVGSGVLASAAAMDKDVTKRLLREAGLPGARGMAVTRRDGVDAETVAAELGWPVFVKPARLGSSVGVGKVETPDSLAAAVAEAFRHDRKILIEECVVGRELECGVLEAEDGTLVTSCVGEIVPSARHAFYSYEAKYLDAEGAEVRAPADLPESLAAEIRAMAAASFRALGCEGLARVDVFLEPSGRLLVNEINTLPGFTPISMYPKAFAASGISYPELVDRLVRHALARAARA